MTIEITRDTENYFDGAGVNRPVDSVHAPDVERGHSKAVFHYFNDDAGVTVGVFEGARAAVVNLSRTDTLALLVRLNEVFGVKHHE